MSDQKHFITYLRLLDADAEGAHWAEAPRIVAHIDPSGEPERARRAWESHLARAKWMIEHRYRDLVLGQCSALTSRAEVFMVIAWNDFYTARWQRLRKLQLTQHPLCKFCGIVTAENTVDHVVPHHGD